MKTVKRLTDDDVRKIIADHFKVKEDKVELEMDDYWRNEDYICEVEIE